MTQKRPLFVESLRIFRLQWNVKDGGRCNLIALLDKAAVSFVPCGPIFYECFEALACGTDRINQGPLCYAVNVV